LKGGVKVNQKKLYRKFKKLYRKKANFSVELGLRVPDKVLQLWIRQYEEKYYCLIHDKKINLGTDSCLGFDYNECGSCMKEGHYADHYVKLSRKKYKDCFWESDILTERNGIITGRMCRECIEEKNDKRPD